MTERIDVHDDPSYTYISSRVLSVEGESNTALNVTSTDAGMVVYYDDYSLDRNGPGALFEAEIFGNASFEKKI